FKETTIKMLPEEVLRMKGIVDGLLEYSKQHALKLSPINLKEVVEGVLAVVAYEVRKNSVEVKKEIPEALPLVMGDKNCLMQILLNLVNNSIQAMRRGGTLNIKLEDLGARVVMKVTDSGIGIPKERIKDIFNPFYTTKDIGTGLGLAITQKLVEEHKGTIDVSSIVGQGTTFAVYLPVATAT
ncbi:MAG: ATP-binding protein, partial [Candidatus Margulisiibacteriota bacterium]